MHLKKKKKKQKQREERSIYLIVEAATDISTIYGWNKSEVLPILPLKVFIIQVARRTVPVRKKKEISFDIRQRSLYKYFAVV